MTNEFESVERSTLADRIYEQVRAAILRGDYADGAELNQVALAKQFGVSRVPVREALQRLESERLLTAEPFRRHTVRTLSGDEVMELIEIRIQLETLGLRRAAPHLDASRLQALHRLNESLRRENDPEEWLLGDWEFHRRLVGPDTACAEMVDDVRLRIHRYLNAAARLGARHETAVGEHHAIVTSLEGRRLEEALDHLRDHILTTGRALVALIDPS